MAEEKAPWEQDEVAPWDQPAGEEVPPWEQDVSGDGEEIIDQMHPDMSMKSRLVYKNFGQDPDAGLKYLKKENPKFKWKMDTEGNPLGRKEGESAWYKLDPSNLELADVGDIAYDIPAGIVQGAATTVAGLAGGAATLPAGGWGAIPAAMATSGVTGTGLEAIRQKIGTMMGVGGEELDPKALAITGGISTLLPGAFGTGAAGKQIAKTALAKGVSQEALKESQSGVIRKYVAPKAGAAISGISSDLINKAKKVLPILRREGGAGEAIPKKVGAIQDTIVSTVKETQSDLGKQIGQMHKVASEQLAGTPNAMVNTDEIIAPLIKLKNEIQKEGLNSPETQGLISEIDSTINSIFSQAKEIPEDEVATHLSAVDELLGIKEPVKKEFEVPKEISMENAWQAYHQLKGKLQSFGGNLEKAGTVEGVAARAPTVTDKRIVGAIGEARIKIKKVMEDKVRVAAEEDSLHEFNRTVNNAISDPNGPAYQGSPSIVQSMLLWDPMAPRGAKELPLKQQIANYTKKAGDKAVNEYNMLNEGFSELGDLASEIKSPSKSPDAVYGWLKRARSNPMVRDKLKTLSNLTGVDLEGEAATIKAMETFGKKTPMEKALEPQMSFSSLARRTPLAGAMAAAGFMVARNLGAEIYGSTMTGAATGALGYALSSPAMLRRYMQMGEFGAKNIAPTLKYAPWMLQEPIQQNLYTPITFREEK